MEEYLKNEIEKYMINPLKYAIVLDGNWGCGKTYFVNNYLNKYKKCYISLNGISSLSSLATQLVYSFLTDNIEIEGSEEDSGKTVKLDKLKKAGREISSLLTGFIESKIHVSINELVEMLSEVDYNDTLIILDDLERSEINIQEVLGFINSLVEHNSLKVLIVVNEKEISKEYFKIKEKLVYQTFMFVPDLEKIYTALNSYSLKQIDDNKEFFIGELRRKEHLNIRTIQFVFQRYSELMLIIDPLLESIECEPPIKEQVRNDIFKYIIVVSIDYKTGNKDDIFKDSAKNLGNYHIGGSQYNTISAFKFVNDFIKGYQLNNESLLEILSSYIDEIKASVTKENGTLNILGRWWEEDDEVILENTTNILEHLRDGFYSFDLYLKILVYLVQITGAGFDNKILENAINYMSDNINNSTEYITFGHRILDAALSKKDLDRFNDYKNNLELLVDKKNEQLNKDGADSVKEQGVGNFGSYLYNWANEHRNDFIAKKSFLNVLGIDNIIYIISNGNSSDIRYLIYLFEDTYRYVGVKEMYPNEANHLNELLSKIENFTFEDNIMKTYNYNDFINTLNKYLENFN